MRGSRRSGVSGGHCSSSPSFPARATAWLREETLSLRYMEYACDLMVLRDRNICPAISGSDRCVPSSGSSRSSAAVRAEAPGAELPFTRASSARRSSACWKDAQEGAPPEDLVGLAEQARAAAVSSNARWHRASSILAWTAR